MTIVFPFMIIAGIHFAAASAAAIIYIHFGVKTPKIVAATFMVVMTTAITVTIVIAEDGGCGNPG